MKCMLVATAALLLTALSVGESHADKCYWSQCNNRCASGAVAMFKQWHARPKNPNSKCLKTWCCHEKLGKKLQKDEGYMCRAHCGTKGSGYGGYFQCMRKCMGGKR
jgi:hypothetical protein